MIVVCGEALIDLVAVEPDLYRALPGGSPANVAVGVSRLGVPVALLARISRDSFGQLLAEHVRQNGVSDRYLVAADEPTTLAVAAFDELGRAAYSFYANGTADWQWRESELPAELDEAASIVHVGSLAVAIEPGASVLEALMRRERDRRLVSYDPNVRPSLEPHPQLMTARVERQVSLAHVVKVSADDLQELYPGRPVDDVARSWVERGARLVVVTEGGDGALAVTERVQVRVGAPEVKIHDTVGAGDSFTAALLAGILRLGEQLGAPLTEAVDRVHQPLLTAVVAEAVAAASLTCTRVGADPPTGEELRRWLGTGGP